MQTVTIKKQIDLENVLGKQLANTVKSWRGQLMKKLPSSVYFTETKPAFYLDDGSTLKCYAIDLAPKEQARKKLSIVNDKYIEGHKQTFGEERKPLKEGEAYCYTCLVCLHLQKCKQQNCLELCEKCGGVLRYSYKEIIINGKAKHEN